MQQSKTSGTASIILASASPRRRELLEQAGYSIRVIVPRQEAECGICDQESAPQMVARLALQKAADVAAQLRDKPVAADVIVACDTVAECLGQVLGKPADRENAGRMLNLLRGQLHRVYSGLCVWPLGPGQRSVQVARTVLRMDPLTDTQIDEYLDSGMWEGKAGAFGYQDRPGWLHIVDGSESNVVGLPMELLAQMLEEADRASRQAAGRTDPGS
jgi:septum formation protein